MKTFLIASLAAAGFQSSEKVFDQSLDLLYPQDDGMEILLERTLPFTFVGHSSHRSHGSHASHRSHGSHRSSSGGSSVSPSPSVPQGNSTSPSTILPLVPQAPSKGEAYKIIVQRIQIGLAIQGYYTGRLDGILGEETRDSILRFQRNKGLSATGTITNELILNLGIPIE